MKKIKSSAAKPPEDALRESELAYRTLVETSHDLIWSVDAQGRWTFVSAAAVRRIYGYEPAEMLGRPFMDFETPEQAVKDLEAFARIKAGTPHFNYETVHQRKDGSPVWLNFNAVVRRDEQGVVLGTTGTAQDITGRKQAEAALAERELQLRVFILHSPAALAMFDRNVRYLAASRRWLTDYRLGDQEIVGRSHYEVFPEVPERWKEIHRRCLAGATEKCEEDPFPRDDGRTDWVRWEIRPWRTAQGDVGGLIMFTEVITERKQAEEALKESLAKLHGIVHAAPVGIALSINRVLWEVNDTLCRMLDYSREELNGRSARILYPTDEDYEYAGREYRQLAELSRASIESRFRRKDGHVIEVAITAVWIDAANPEAGVVFTAMDITGRKQAEEALRLESAALEAAANAIFITDRNGLIQYMNPAFTTMSGYTAGEAIGRKPNLVKSGAHDEAFYRDLWQTVLGGRVWRGQITNRHKDGHLYVTEQTNSPVKDARGEIVNFVSVQHDITVRKQTERARDHSLSLTRATLESTADGILVVNSEGKIEIFNHVFAQMWRLPDDLLASNDDERALQWVLDQLSEPQKFIEKVRYLYAHPQEESFDSLTFKDGRVFERFSRPQFIGGQVVGRVWSFRDITERKQAEEELRWRTAFFEAQVDSALDGILVVNSQGKKILQNRRLAEMWKIPREIAEDKDDARQIQFVMGRTKNARQFAEKIAYLYSHQDEISRDEIELIDGTILDRYSAPVRDEQGKHYGRIWTFRDITERQALEEQLRQTQKMDAIGQLSGGVAHDFNNLLTAIIGNLGLLRSNAQLTPEIARSLDEIGDAANRAASLTRQLLAFSRRQVMQQRNLDLNEVVEQMTQMLRRMVGEDVAMQVDYALEPMTIHGDPGMMEQVLLNLAVNARDAMPAGGTLRIVTRSESLDRVGAPARSGAFVRLSVSDTGTGIAPEIIPRIFEPFFTTKEVGRGTGLGLATVFGIVRQHQGWIEVKSEVGQGTVFHVYLPRISVQRAAGPGEVPAAPGRGRSETILLVEDDKAVRELGLMALSQYGYQVITATSGAEALAVWAGHKEEIALLLTDLIMPGGISGLQLARQLLQQKPSLRVVYTSGYSAEIAGKELPMKDGVNYLGKPYELDALFRTMRTALDGEVSRPPF